MVIEMMELRMERNQLVCDVCEVEKEWCGTKGRGRDESSVLKW